jgi:hypothetical protein
MRASEGRVVHRKWEKRVMNDEVWKVWIKNGKSNHIVVSLVGLARRFYD